MILSLHIRKAAIADLPAIEHILQVNDLTSDDVAYRLQNFFVAGSDGSVVGTIGMEFYHKTALLRSAAVLPSYQNRGIGDELVARITDHAQERGVEEIILLTTTASKYFARKGFAAINRNEISGEILTSTQFNGACPATAISMRKKL